MSEIRRVKMRDQDGDTIEFRGDLEDDSFYFTARQRYADTTTAGRFSKDEVLLFLDEIKSRLMGEVAPPEFIVDKKRP